MDYVHYHSGLVGFLFIFKRSLIKMNKKQENCEILQFKTTCFHFNIL